MNTAPISAASNVVSGNATKRNDAAMASDDSIGPFSDVLGRQQASPATPSVEASSQRGAKASKEAGKQTDGEAPTATADDNGHVLATHASEHGLGLPEIALQIAAQVKSLQQPALEKRDNGSTALTRTSAVIGNGIETSAGLDAKAAGPTRLESGFERLLSNRSVLANAHPPVAGRADTIAPSTSQNVSKTAATKLAKPILPGAQTQTSSPAFEPGQAKAGATATSATLTALTVGQNERFGDATDTINAGQTDALAGAGQTGSGTSLLGHTMAAVANSGNPSSLPGIATPLQSPQWASDFGRQFVSLVQGGHNTPHTAELRLDPPELGPLRISINISDNVAHAIFVSPHALVRQTIESALPQLQQLLEQAGISLGQTSVSDQGHSEQTFDESLGNQHSSLAAAPGTGRSNHSEAISASPVRQRIPDALVDTFA